MKIIKKKKCDNLYPNPVHTNIYRDINLKFVKEAREISNTEIVKIHLYDFQNVVLKQCTGQF